MTGSLLGIKQTSNPKVNRGCAPLTANRTSADCVQISLDPQYHIFHWGSTILGDSTLCNKPLPEPVLTQICVDFWRR